MALDPEQQESIPYEPQDAIGKATQGVLICGSAGFLFSAVQNVMTRENVGALGVLTKFGGSTAIFATVGGTYGFISAASANLREKKDPISEATGGFFAGAAAGLRSRAVGTVLGSGVLMAVGLGAMAFTANTIAKSSEEADEIRQARKDEIRKRFRRPINELVNEIGEGRGIYPPGYDERRKERIKQRYGFEIQEPYYNNESAAGEQLLAHETGRPDVHAQI